MSMKTIWKKYLVCSLCIWDYWDSSSVRLLKLQFILPQIYFFYFSGNFGEVVRVQLVIDREVSI